MKVKDLLHVCRYSLIELHSSYNGKLIATSAKSLEKYAEVNIISVYPQIKVPKHSGEYARAFLYVYVSSSEVEAIKEESAK